MSWLTSSSQQNHLPCLDLIPGPEAIEINSPSDRLTIIVSTIPGQALVPDRLMIIQERTNSLPEYIEYLDLHRAGLFCWGLTRRLLMRKSLADRK